MLRKSIYGGYPRIKPWKNLTTAEGGAVTWINRPGLNDDEVYQQYMLLSLHGQSKDALAKMKLGSWEYDIVYPAYKCNMTDLTAAFGLAQLSRFEALTNTRKLIHQKYHVLDKSKHAEHLQFEEYGGASFYQSIEYFTLDEQSKGVNRAIQTWHPRSMSLFLRTSRLKVEQFRFHRQLMSSNSRRLPTTCWR